MIQKISNKFSLGALLPNVHILSKKIDEIIDWLNGTKGIGSYKTYTFDLIQNGTNAPVPTTRYNNLGYTPTFSYITDGTFSIDFPPEALGKIFVVTGNRSFYINSTDNINTSFNVVSTTVDIGSRLNGVLTNSLIGQNGDCSVEIRVYN
jgi:hypothetical protein